jgi:hypothetical protein
MCVCVGGGTSRGGSPVVKGHLELCASGARKALGHRCRVVCVRQPSAVFTLVVQRTHETLVTIAPEQASTSVRARACVYMRV